MTELKAPTMQRISVDGGITLFEMENDGAKLLSTNYFDSKFGKAQLMYLSFNAFAGRLLIPDSHKDQILSEVKTARHAVLSMGKIYDPVKKHWQEMGELMFEDDSSAPFSVMIQRDLIDRTIRRENQESTLTLHTRDGASPTTFKLYIRTVGELPHMLPWKP